MKAALIVHLKRVRMVSRSAILLEQSMGHFEPLDFIRKFKLPALVYSPLRFQPPPFERLSKNLLLQPSVFGKLLLTGGAHFFATAITHPNNTTGPCRPSHRATGGFLVSRRLQLPVGQF
jgi:hypothetical protein